MSQRDRNSKIGTLANVVHWISSCDVVHRPCPPSAPQPDRRLLLCFRILLGLNSRETVERGDGERKNERRQEEVVASSPLKHQAYSALCCAVNVPTAGGSRGSPAGFTVKAFRRTRLPSKGSRRFTSTRPCGTAWLGTTRPCLTPSPSKCRASRLQR